ncbi:tripartite tricarboxylate transporter substrate binding protein [Variovorax sp. J22R133]|uniref:Bug family tripartite tricarboxylate transporter substrate binding protein n=1 Tax=Variovorax brevis TaxID=3053503 RepID=UPI002575B2D0|nr:tripartite tricarboxylate transporter substrate binding protein [Variovorax sp. J22R133]MDM0116308.1 tripartite tricarboxylate transporter substrate binding protein [Variovorax sp. J22R133]
MTKFIRKLVKLAAVAGATLTFASAQAQSWPTRPIKLILGVAPGGLIDLSARQLATELGAKLGQPVIVDNRPGANTTIGANAVVQAPGDGYTFFYGGVMSASPVFVKTNAVDVTTQLKPVSLVLSSPFFVVVNSKVPAKTFQELVDYSKKNPDAVNFADGAPLSTMVMYAIASRTGLKFTAIPYKGSGPSLQALISGEVQMNLDTVPNYVQHIQAGTVRPLLNTSNVKYSALPDVPTAADVKGLDKLNAASVLSMWAPKTTPDEIVNKMSGAIAAIARDPAFRTKFKASTNVDPIGSTPAELLSAVKADKALYEQVTKQVGYVPQ